MKMVDLHCIDMNIVWFMLHSLTKGKNMEALHKIVNCYKDYIFFTQDFKFVEG